jgi:hypothetical protein
MIAFVDTSTSPPPRISAKTQQTRASQQGGPHRRETFDRQDLVKYRRTTISPMKNRALAACAAFQDDVLLVEFRRR